MRERKIKIFQSVQVSCVCGVTGSCLYFVEVLFPEGQLWGKSFLFLFSLFLSGKTISTQHCSVVLIPKDPYFGNELKPGLETGEEPCSTAKNACVCRERRGGGNTSSFVSLLRRPSQCASHPVHSLLLWPFVVVLCLLFQSFLGKCSEICSIEQETDVLCFIGLEPRASPSAARLLSIQLHIQWSSSNSTTGADFNQEFNPVVHIQKPNTVHVHVKVLPPAGFNTRPDSLSNMT